VCVCVCVCVKVSAAKLKKNDPEVFKLGIGNDLGVDLSFK